MTLRLGVFVAPDASQPDTTVEAILAADRAGLDLVGVQDHPYQRRFFDTLRGDPRSRVAPTRWYFRAAASRPAVSRTRKDGE